MQIFDNDKIKFLPDAILSINKIKLERDNNIENINIINKKIILSVGRLTKQKNFSYLIKEFKNLLNKMIIIVSIYWVKVKKEII